MKITTIGIDLAKEVFQIHGVDKHGKAVLRKRLRRSEMVRFFVNLEPCLIVMEACGSSPYWARKLCEFGHTVKLMSSQFVKPYMKTNKHDMADAEAICEAVSRSNMRFVPIKNVEQQTILAILVARTHFTSVPSRVLGQIYQQTFVDTCSKWATAKLYTTKTPITSADLLNDRVLPFFAEQGMGVIRILIDRGTEYCGKPENHDYRLYLALNDIEHSKTKANHPQTNGICERFHHR